MAKKFKVKEGAVSSVGNLAAVSAFQPAVVSTQVGDKFYVPTSDMLMIIGTKPTTPRAGGPEVVGQRFVAVLLDENNKPLEARQLYVGQLVKTNVRGAFAFPESSLVKAYRKSPTAFADLILGKVITAAEETEIDDRSWDPQANAYRRNPDNNSLVSEKRRALRFEAAPITLSKADVEKANEMLIEFYQNTDGYKELVEVDEK